jgi:archaellum biogenesis protein FlaJ (TadC family)
MGSSLVYTMVLAFLGGVFFIGIALGLDMRRFLARTPALRSAKDLQALRRVVARNMYVVLILMALAAAWLLLVAVALYQSWLAWHDLQLILLAGVPLTVVGVWAKSVESRVKSTPAVNETLREERDKVFSVWASRALPDW